MYRPYALSSSSSKGFYSQKPRANYSIALHSKNTSTNYLLTLMKKMRKDVAGVVRITCSNFVTSSRLWFSSSSHIMSVTSWMFDACFVKSAAETVFIDIQ